MRMRLCGASPRPLLRIYALGIAVVWTALVAALLLLGLDRNRQVIHDLVLTKARAHFERELAFRRWAASHGGAYVEVGEDTPENPNLAHMPERDLVTPSGRQLTLMNPAYMRRQIDERILSVSGMQARTTSLDALRAESAPDAWERRALHALAQGESEVSEVVHIGDERVLRLLRPMIIEEDCLACHDSHGHRLGDVCGGVSVTLSLEPYLSQANVIDHGHIATLALIWILGLGGIGFGAQRINLRMAERERSERSLAEHRSQLEQAIQRRTATLTELNQALRQEDLARERVTRLLRIQHDLALGLASTSDLAEALRLILMAALKIEGIDCGGVYFRDPDSGSLDLVAHHGLTEGFVARSAHFAGDSPQAAMIAAGRPIYSAYSELDMPLDAAAKGEPLGSIAVIPVRCAGEVVAALNMASHTNAGMTASTRDLLEAIAAQVGDIIRRVRAEEAMRESTQRYRALFDGVTDAVYIHDLSGALLEVNTVACRSLGYERRELLRMKLHEIGTPEVARGLGQRIARLQQEGGSLVSEAVFRSRSGEGIPFELSSHIVEYAGRPAVLSVARDITERRRAEAEREAILRELSAKNRELEQYAYTVSHDLKGPLITIRGFSDLLAKTVVDDERATSYAARIGKAATTMGQLLDELLRLSRIGRVMEAQEEIEVGRLVQEIVDVMSGVLRKAGVSVEIAPDLPTVLGDRARFWEVIQNLIDNACKYMGRQSHPRIGIGVRGSGPEAVFIVQDNGMGIDPRFQEKIFGLFERLGRDTPGTGVGLAIVKRIVECNGGRIWVESAGRGKGSTFCFTWPAEAQTSCSTSVTN